MRAAIVKAQEVFNLACEHTRTSSLEAEISWQRETDFMSFSESQLLREAAWVILCSGFKEATVRRMFDHISLCFCDWESAQSITVHGQKCVMAARASMNSETKLNAILTCAVMVRNQGFNAFKAAVVENPIAELQKFPFVGPITVWHLAKNLGLNVAKPDRHLARLAEKCGYESVKKLCEELAIKNGEKVKVVDLILWRYLADVTGRASVLNE